MKNEKDKENNDVIDFERKRRIRGNLEKIKAVFENDPEGLDKLTEKLQRLDNDETNNT